MKLSKEQKQHVDRLRQVLDRVKGNYKKLNGAKDFADYLDRTASREDEEILTEPILADLMQTLLGFPPDSYFPQLGRSGLKPDFTPHDLIAHSFVLDAKSSTQNLSSHEKQIRSYIDQRQLDGGILFNLREVRVYTRGGKGHDTKLSFDLLPLWRVARGEAMPSEEVQRLEDFVARFRYREMGLDEKIDEIRNADPWTLKEAEGKPVVVDVDFLIDRLRGLSDELIGDAAGQRDALEAHSSLHPGFEDALLAELQAIAQDVAPGTDVGTLPDSVVGYIDGDELSATIWRQYLRRVAQLALARILLFRAWEEVGFVDEHLYDGGFDQVYERVGRNLRAVLDEAFARGSQRYRWLFGADNNYDWFKPRDQALADVLYSLTPVPLGKLDADVLGALYASYVDEIDRDRLGQFYTPRSVVRFMLDRAGFTDRSLFKLEGDSRNPVRILDFATGSGGFLVEAARRLIDESGVENDDKQGLTEALAALVQGFHGCEISPFPYYLTEINLLLQVSRLLGRLRLAGADPGSFVLGVVHADTLTTRDVGTLSIEGMSAADRADRAKLESDQRYGLVALDAEKQRAYSDIRENDSFDLVIGNPPYVFESGNKLLFERLRAIPSWADDYRGKSDYLYYFLTLAAEKVAPGGKLCVIVPAGWMNAGNADWLRENLTSSLRLDELFLFGAYPLFAPDAESGAKEHRAPTPLVESAILVATKAKAPRNHTLNVVVLEDERKAGAALGGSREVRSPARDDLLAEMGVRIRGKPGRRNGFHFHRVEQGKLDPSRPWPVKHGAEDVPTRVVMHLQKQLDDPAVGVERLAAGWKIFTGIETGADSYSKRVAKRLRQSFSKAAKKIENEGVAIGDPILELPAGAEKQEPWLSFPDVLARSVEPHAILYGALDEASYTSLVWLDRGDTPPAAILQALEKWRPALESRAEFVRNSKREWWECAWPRDKQDMRSPKVIALYRTDRGRFGLDEDGSWQTSKKTTLTVARPEQNGSVAYLCGLLNSELLDLWYGVRGKTPRDVWRNYEPKPMAEIPYRRIDLSVEVDGERIEKLTAAAAAPGAGDAVGLAADLAADLRASDDAGESSPLAVEVAKGVEALVRAVAANRQALLPYRAVFPDLGRVVKNPWSVGPAHPDERAAIEMLSKAQVASVRTDPELSVHVETDGALGRAALVDGEMRLTHSRQRTATVTGPGEKLAMVEKLLAGRKKLMPKDLEALLLPKDIDKFRAGLRVQAAEVDALLRQGRDLVEAVERLVCALYRVDQELEDEIVAHALERVVAPPEAVDD